MLECGFRKMHSSIHATRFIPSEAVKVIALQRTMFPNFSVRLYCFGKRSPGDFDLLLHTRVLIGQTSYHHYPNLPCHQFDNCTLANPFPSKRAR